MFYKIGVLKTFCRIHRKTPVPESLFNKLTGLYLATLLKGYLRYKTITSQNVPSKAQIKNSLFRRKIMLHSQDIQVFVFLTIP